MSREEQEQELRKNYEWGPMWREDVAAAEEAFQIVHRHQNGKSVYVEGKSCFATRYAVLVTENPMGMRQVREENFTFAVMDPWCRTILLHLPKGNDVELIYVREQLQVEGLVHGGDLMGVALCMADGVNTLLDMHGTFGRTQVTT